MTDFDFERSWNSWPRRLERWWLMLRYWRGLEDWWQAVIYWWRFGR